MSHLVRHMHYCRAMIPDEKRCTVCGEVKPAAEYYRVKNGRYLMPRCRKCHIADTTARYKAWSPEKKAARVAKLRYAHHRLSVEQVDAMTTEQDGRCYLCQLTVGEAGWRGPGEPRGAAGLTIDHDHVTGTLRRLLCSNCNLAIGNAKDDPDLLRRMADYVESYRNEVR